eukprot:TRINITY_DN21465_c0_g1_i3.p1 TRINITY_DN21465_c0_g1~~TRINITY_DN21465_c0_g1_i3.p1  ORF type:complete len:149 (+),score=9.61 TRINITY_DN21465_c0_g1_i3:188-634(+)
MCIRDSYVYQPPPARTVEESRQRLQQALQQKEDRLLSNNSAAPQLQRPYSAQVRPRADQTGVVDLNLTATSDLSSHDNPHGNTSLLGGRFVARSQRTQFGGSRPPSAGARRTTSSGSLRSAGGNMFPANPRPGNEIRVGSGFVVYPKV